MQTSSSAVIFVLFYRRVHRDRRRSGKRHERADDRTLSYAGSVELHRISCQRAAEDVDQLPTKLTNNISNFFFLYLFLYYGRHKIILYLLQSRKAPTFYHYILYNKVYIQDKMLTFFYHQYII